MEKDGKRIAIVCGTFGSDEVGRDARANRDVRIQEGVLGNVFDYGHYHRCV